MILFSGVPAFWQWWFTLALLVVLYTLTWKSILYRSSRKWQNQDSQTAFPRGHHPLLWVFLVPALNEEITLQQTVQKLLDLPIKNKYILVIDDASDDQTPAILNSFDDPDLGVLRRDFPAAQTGKAHSLNQAYQELAGIIAVSGFSRHNTLLTVVDADGYVDDDIEDRISKSFQDPRLGGLQLQVRIYNRHKLITKLQDIEFGVFGYLFQAGRSRWNTACMGGSGQVTRVAALDDIIDDGSDGPWRDKLTEDQDLGLRLMMKDWGLLHLNDCFVHQQGLYSMRALLRQRVRWSQGNLQTIPVWRELWNSKLGRLGKLEMIGFLFMPFLQLIVGVALIGALWLWLSGQSDLLPLNNLILLGVFYVLGVGGVILGCTAGAPSCGKKTYWQGFLIAHPYIIYTWILWPVLVRALVRVIMRKDSWSKTEREVLAAA